MASEVKKIKSMRQEYTDNQIRTAISWLSNNQDKFPGGIHSIGGILRSTIGQALAEVRKEHQLINQDSLEAEEYMKNPANSKVAMAVLKTLNVNIHTNNQQAA